VETKRCATVRTAAGSHHGHFCSSWSPGRGSPFPEKLLFQRRILDIITLHLLLLFRVFLDDQTRAPQPVSCLQTRCLHVEPTSPIRFESQMKVTLRISSERQGSFVLTNSSWGKKAQLFTSNMYPCSVYFCVRRKR